MRSLHIFSNESGQTVIVFALCMVVIMAFLGLAIDVGHLRYAKRNLQKAADAAALAAGLEVRICGGTASCSAMKAAAQDALVENGFAGSTLITNCATPGTGLTLTLNNGPCALGANDPNAGKLNYVEVEVSQTLQTYFAQIVGYNNVPITARAEASRGVGGPCIYALDQSGSSALSVTVALGIQATCAIVDESSSPNAASCLAGLVMSAPRISITGGATGLLCTVTPASALRVGVPLPAPLDPLAYLPVPSIGACGSTTGSPYTGSPSAVNVGLLGGNVVFNPGVYCGGISITAALLTNVTFMPGMYILEDKTVGGLLGPTTTGGLKIALSLLSNISGQGVTFYNEGPTTGFNLTAPTTLGLSNFSLTAPTSGEYGGVLFWQAAGITAQGNFVANLLTGSKLDGAIYLPAAPVIYGVGAVSSDYTILVAKDINFTVAVLSTFGNNYATLQSGSPLRGDDAVLVQ